MGALLRPALRPKGIFEIAAPLIPPLSLSRHLPDKGGDRWDCAAALGNRMHFSFFEYNIGLR